MAWIFEACGNCCYNTSTDCWQLTDINDFEEETSDYYLCYDTKALTSELLNAFNDDETCLMRIKLIARTATFTPEFISEFNSCLANFAKIDKRRAQMTNGDRVGLLYLEAYQGNLDRVMRLLDLGADPCQTSLSKGYDPARMACENGHLAVIKALYKTGKFDINQQQVNDGNTSLLIACYNKHWHLVRYLLNRKEIDVNIPNDKGVTALHLIVTAEQIDICALFLEKNVKVSVSAPELGTPLEIAKILQNERLEAQLKQKALLHDAQVSERLQSPLFSGNH